MIIFRSFTTQIAKVSLTLKSRICATLKRRRRLRVKCSTTANRKPMVAASATPKNRNENDLDACAAGRAVSRRVNPELGIRSHSRLPGASLI